MIMQCKVITKKGYETIEFRQPKIIDFFGLCFNGPPAVESIIVLASRLSGKNKKYFEELDAANLAEISKVMGKMLEPLQGFNVVK